MADKIERIDQTSRHGEKSSVQEEVAMRNLMCSYNAGLVSVLLLTLSCRGNVDKPRTSHVREVDGVDLVSARAGKCYGRLRFPKEDAEFEQEVGIVSSELEGAAERAYKLAREKLLARVCAAKGPECLGVARFIRPWDSLEDGGKTCAFVLLDTDDLASFESRPRDELAARQEALDAAIESAAFELVKVLRGTDRVAIEPVDVECVEGGYIADWMIDRLGAAMSKRGVEMVEVRAGTKGVDLPKLDVTLRALEQLGPSKPEPGYEVSLAVYRGNSVTRLEPASFSASVAPRQPAHPSGCTPLQALNSPELGLYWEQPIRGGALCEYQKSRLYARASQPGYIRLIALAPETDEAIVFFPENRAQSDKLDAGDAVDLLGADARIFKIHEGQTAETQIMLHAKHREDLGPLLSGVREMCRLAPDEVARLIAGELIEPSLKTYVRTYTILDGAQCDQFDTPKVRELRRQVRKILAELPYCSALSAGD